MHLHGLLSQPPQFFLNKLHVLQNPVKLRKSTKNVYG